MSEIARLLSLLATTTSIGSIIFIYNKTNISSQKIMSQKILSAGTLALSLTLVSFTWRYEDVSPLTQLILTLGASISFILTCIMVQYNKLKLATYATISTIILATLHTLIAFTTTLLN
ncbi:hypothetical protein SAMN05660649_00958 [Desulfotomaculum arcticum]|uniref:Uncharacterized protein n=1 Tax=Desulfotruncus arcticus DSM 17038 TaxID=1121424 RepID=A0A1I2PKP4_9FIRM|nr:hypothetical protein SAMN05660649_00958 [Desulfotomaculum arcticum] [Desulfotruncus arcticus DSM 17038]